MDEQKIYYNANSGFFELFSPARIAYILSKCRQSYNVDQINLAIVPGNDIWEKMIFYRSQVRKYCQRALVEAKTSERGSQQNSSPNRVTITEKDVDGADKKDVIAPRDGPNRKIKAMDIWETQDATGKLPYLKNE